MPFRKGPLLIDGVVVLCKGEYEASVPKGRSMPSMRYVAIDRQPSKRPQACCDVVVALDVEVQVSAVSNYR